MVVWQAATFLPGRCAATGVRSAAQPSSSMAGRPSRGSGKSTICQLSRELRR